MKTLVRSAAALALLSTLPLTAASQQRTLPADSALAHAILREIIAIPSISETPVTVDAARALASRLKAAGYTDADVSVTGPKPERGNLVARLRGRGARPPILLLAHLDVVPALRSDWSTDPFVLTDSAGWWYGRGTSDNKGAAATLVTNLIRWKREGFVPERDIVVVITADEETDSESIKWFMRGDGRRLVGNPELALNFDAGGGNIYGGREALFEIQTSEKVYVSYRLTARDPGGHSSVPRPGNAIYTLARALTRIAAHHFPIELNETTRAFLLRSAAFEHDSIARLMRRVAAMPMDAAAADRLAATPRFNALLRTTCVATQLRGGHAENALPQTAEAVVNCRLMPGTDTAAVVRTLRQVIGDAVIEIAEIDDSTPSPPSPITPTIFGTIERLANQFWPGVVVVPNMSTGATDGLYVRNAGIPVYGVDAVFTLPDESRAHGRDERVEIRRFYESLEWMKRIVEALASR
jgi:acetylornithine deacetylase/succinyl-diaminopimelate desuccinylase-like protein